MNITRYEPRNLYRDLSNDINRMLTGRLGNFITFDDPALENTDWVPAVDVKEADDKFVIHADVPGVDPADIDVRMENGMLTISGKRESKIKDEEDGYRRVERVYGEFYRRFSLPDSADPDKVTAKCDKGVLEVTIGKSEARKPKRISVKS